DKESGVMLAREQARNARARHGPLRTTVRRTRRARTHRRSNARPSRHRIARPYRLLPRYGVSVMSPGRPGMDPSFDWRSIDDRMSRHRFGHSVRTRTPKETEYADAAMDQTRRARRDMSRRNFIGLVAGWSGGLVPVLFISALAAHVG